MKDKLKDDTEEIIRLYTDEKLGHCVIAKIYGVDGLTIKNRLIKNGIEIDSNTRFGDRKKKYKYPECSVDFCSNKSTHKYKGVYYCGRHFSQIIETGKILNRTKFDKNEIRILDGWCEMDLYDASHNVVDICYFDKNLYDEISKYKWFSDRQGYVVRKDAETNKRISMHRYVMGILGDSSKIVDHLNRNKSDNRLCNLRLVDDSKNEMNKEIRSNNTSGVKGVSKKRNSWTSEIKINDIKHRKVFKIFDDAVKNRIILEAIYFKEYSNNYNFDTQTIQLTYLSHDDQCQTFIEVSLQGDIIQFKKLS
jgi:hypothetical protein